jgi:hypothetical protein
MFCPDQSQWITEKDYECLPCNAKQYNMHGSRESGYRILDGGGG